MTETQQSILDKLNDGDMRVLELSEELNIIPNVLRKRLNQMEKNNWIKKDGSYYSIVMNYAPNIAWNFKPLLKAWRKK